ncbi:hypothetical protein B5T_00851 [Alloalcanivorax dieselolei B5]|uniref:Uncharacterized protein n=1 Tax=Alcanivorax dieselolei (strain DSM 16502 / CGMCC 1.3690 / MCCC 1A00001 / B-5) TaxID=930169 RepID=K0C9B2_ALCDB|nr:hypothetical protein [Alloalcanivorax dieselolei]AFT69135.1 hypothetical protein B5T_00851 [Alloalcanivorax dieselolei B5]GGJ82796.1 hypothetical protein GCM10007426_09850 [Alloalcanivorax dieselolei]
MKKEAWLLRHLIGVISLAVVLPVSVESAWADTLEGVLEGESLSWHVLHADDASTASFFSIAPGMTSYQIQGHREERFSVAGSISLSFTVMNGKLLAEPEVSFFPEKKLFPMYSNEGQGKLTIEHLENGGVPRAKGRYQGTLVRLEGVGKDADRSDTLTLDLLFDVHLRADD